MEEFYIFIHTLCPVQEKFKSKIQAPTQTINQTPDSLSVSINEPFKTWYKFYTLTDDEVNHLSIVENSQNYNLYTSILYLLYPKYHLAFKYEQKMELVSELIRFMSYKIETDLPIKTYLQSVHIRANPLLIDIKNKLIQSDGVVKFISLLLDINIIVIPLCQPGPISVYFSDLEYDNCKPHIILAYDTQQVYHPVTYQDQCILNYFEHSIICTLLEKNKITEKIFHKN